jgi:hypothetical protein
MIVFSFYVLLELSVPLSSPVGLENKTASGVHFIPWPLRSGGV